MTSHLIKQKFRHTDLYLDLHQIITQNPFILITFILYQGYSIKQSSNTCFNFIVKQLKRLQYRCSWSQPSNKLFACWSSSLQTFGKLSLDSLTSCFTLRKINNLDYFDAVHPVCATRMVIGSGLIKMLKAETIASEIDELL